MIEHIIESSKCIPKVLYKYFSRQRIDFFRCPELRCSPTKELNDIFEGVLPYCTCQGEIYLPSKYGNKLTSASTGSTDSLILWEQIDQGGYLGWVKGWAGILCLSASNNQNSMWSHYADSHRGVVVGFDTSHEFFHPDNPNGAPIRRLFKVMYLQGRPSMADFNFSTWPVLYSKSGEWSREEEWRIVQRIGVGHDCEYDMKASDGSVLGLVEIESSAIKEVCVGSKASPDLEYMVKSFCDKRGIKFNKIKLPLVGNGLEHEESSIEGGTDKNVGLFSPGHEFEIRYANAESFVLNKKGPV